jgi:hypothetical protein
MNIRVKNFKLKEKIETMFVKCFLVDLILVILVCSWAATRNLGVVVVVVVAITSPVMDPSLFPVGSMDVISCASD